MNRDAIYRKQNLGNSSGMGARCGLLLVDFIESFLDEDRLGSRHIQKAADATLPLLEAFRSARLPVAHTRVVFADDGSNHNVFCLKMPGLRDLTETAPGSRITAALRPRNGELVIRKTVPSAFFGTELAPWLLFKNVDSLAIAGCTTSGCVRASVIDAMQWNFRTIVIEDCVGDRADEPHEANLFDMKQKYADVHRRDDFLKLLR